MIHVHEARFLEAIKASELKHVTIIDDAFDPPQLTDRTGGQLLDFFENASLASVRRDAGLTPEAEREALTALAQNKYDAEPLLAAIAALYEHYVVTLDPRFDPDEIFKTAKGDNLRNLLPLLTLLSRCNPALQIVRIGSSPEAIEGLSDKTELVFVDFYLDKSLAADDDTSTKKKLAAKEASLKRVRQIMDKSGDDSPSVVLMSSHKVRDRAEKFRSEIGGGKVFASRFAFLEKTQIKLSSESKIGIEDEAADELLDIVQTYGFGRGLHAAMTCWLSASRKATDLLWTEIEQLGLKDLAYLARFRLAQEGQGLLEYLEWFFGECLLNSLGNCLDEIVVGDDRIKGLTGDALERIEDAFDGPTVKIADLYHRVRIEPPRTNRVTNFRLGDLYLIGSGRSRTLEAVMTPDCDLMVRPSGKRDAPRLLTVTGRLKRFDTPEASVADFIMLNDKPYNVRWNRKELKAHEFDAWPRPGDSSEDIKFLGTLRPLYALELQRDVLSDLGRVGLSIAPAIGMTAAVKVTARKKGGKTFDVPLTGLSNAPAYLVPSRGGNDKSVVIFKRQFVKSLLEALRNLSADELSEDAAGHLGQIKAPLAYSKFSKLFQSGLTLEEIVDCGIFLTGKPSKPSHWCWISVSMDDASE
jgi:hypothetical protein